MRISDYAIFGALGLTVIGTYLGGVIGASMDVDSILKGHKGETVKYINETEFTPRIESDNPNMDKGIYYGSVIGLITGGLCGLVADSYINNRKKIYDDKE